MRVPQRDGGMCVTTVGRSALRAENYPGEIGPQGCYLGSCPQKGFAPKRQFLHCSDSHCCTVCLTVRVLLVGRTYVLDVRRVKYIHGNK